MAGRDSVDRSMEAMLGTTLIAQILDAGYNFDFIDDRAIEKVGVPHRILILPNVERIPLSTYQKLKTYIEKGGIVVATRRPPWLAPGLIEGERDTAAVRDLTAQLFNVAAPRTRLVGDERSLGTELITFLTPDVAANPPSPGLGFIHRKLDSGELYFVANTTNQPMRTMAAFRVTGMQAERWNPFTGKAEGVKATAGAQGVTIALDLAPYESTVFTFAKTSVPQQRAAEATAVLLDLSHDWKLTFNDPPRSITIKTLRSSTAY